MSLQGNPRCFMKWKILCCVKTHGSGGDNDECAKGKGLNCLCAGVGVNINLQYLPSTGG